MEKDAGTLPRRIARRVAKWWDGKPSKEPMYEGDRDMPILRAPQNELPALRRWYEWLAEHPNSPVTRVVVGVCISTGVAAITGSAYLLWRLIVR